MKSTFSRLTVLVLINAFALGSFSVTASAVPTIFGQSELPNRVASGDTTATSTILWARGSSAGAIFFVLSTNEELNDPRSIVRVVPKHISDPSRPVKVYVDGLRPGTEYFYFVIDSQHRFSKGRFVTAQPGNVNAGLKFGVSGDWRGELAPYPSISNADDRNLGFFLSLGDTVYADVPSPDLPIQALTLQDFRIKHNEVYSDRFGLNTLGDLRSSTSILATIDDHEVTNDFAGGALATTHPRFSIYGNVLINDTPLYDNGLRAFQEYNPVADSFYPNSGEARSAGERKLYRFNTYGKDAAVFVLDARSFRDLELVPANFTDPLDVARLLTQSFDPTRTMLGTRQLQDLKQDLLAAHERGVTWKFVMVPEPIQNFGPLGASDRFEGYAAERNDLLRFITQNDIQNVVFVAADIHGTVINNLTYQDVPFGPQIQTASWEITTGPVAFERPFGPTVISAAAAAGLITPAQVAFYNSLPVAPDADDIPNDKDDFLKGLINAQITPAPLNYDAIGLNGSAIPATLLQGDYVVVHTFGWTEFEIDRFSQQLKVTTYGIPSYNTTVLNSDPQSVVNRVPTIMNQFVVSAQ